jgi:hypothetical protein
MGASAFHHTVASPIDSGLPEEAIMSTPRPGPSFAVLAVTISLAACKGTPQASPTGGQPAGSPAAAASAPPAREVRGPVPGTRITEGYARMLARDTYFWAWPMVNIYNKRLACELSRETEQV